MDTDYDVIVIGGGISGLTAAWHLKKAGVHVGLLEAAATVGGCTRTTLRDGFLLEEGPFNVIVRDPAFEALLSNLSEDVAVVSAGAAANARYIYRDGRLCKVPSNPIALATTPLLSPLARCRLLTGLLISRRAGVSEETMEQAAIRRFGRQVSDTLISAVIAGIFAGDIRKLSLNACFPSAGKVDAEARSLIGYGLRGALRSRRKNGRTKRRWRGLVSVEGGLGSLMEALAKPLGEDLRTSSPVDAVRRTQDGYEIEYRCKGEPHRCACRRLLMATPAATTAALLASLVPDAAKLIETVHSASLVVLNLGFKKEDVGHPLQGYGFLVPHDEPTFPLMGVLWADSIFPNHAPPDRRLMRVFIGGARDPGAVQRSDDELLTLALEALHDLLKLTGDPILVHVSRYDSAIPQYELGHTEKRDRILADVEKQPGLQLVGNYLNGVSLNDCVRSATNVAQEIVAVMNSKKP